MSGKYKEEQEKDKMYAGHSIGVGKYISYCGTGFAFRWGGGGVSFSDVLSHFTPEVVTFAVKHSRMNFKELVNLIFFYFLYF
jgi:hypothetical protein